jgi:hypothetical protein
LNFWRKSWPYIKTQSFELPIPNITKIVYTDASGHSCGGYIENLEGTELVQAWSEDEKLKSSTWRELRALQIFISVHKELLKKQQILCYTDNKNLISIMRKGSMKPELLTMALDVFRICVMETITFNLVWVPRSQNEAADFLSKIVDIDGWSIDNIMFYFLQKTNQKFTLDVFASMENAKCVKFYSKYWCTGTLGVNALCFSWEKEFCWIVPPPSLILQTIMHVCQHKVKGILIIPKWESAVFWPLLYVEGELPRGWDLLQEYVKPKKFFVQKESTNSMFTCGAFSGNVLVFRIWN